MNKSKVCKRLIIDNLKNVRNDTSGTCVAARQHVTTELHINLMSLSLQSLYYFLNNSVNKSSAVIEMGDRFATIDMTRKVCGLLLPFSWKGKLGPI